MLTFSHKAIRILARTLPLCPKPKAFGWENIPEEGPIIFVHNHITRRPEGFFLVLAAPPKSNIRGLVDNTVTNPKYLPKVKEGIEEILFPQRYQRKRKKSRLKKLCYTKLIDYLARYVIAQTNRYGLIGVETYETTTEEERLKRQRINKQAFHECINSLENNIPLAIAPSGGKTYETVEKPVYNTLIPTLSAWLYRQGKVVKIVPSVVKEKPMISRTTYWRYVADRIFFYKAIRWLLNLFRIKSYKRPFLTVEFLRPLTFENAKPSKSEKIEFVKNLQQIIYDTLKRK